MSLPPFYENILSKIDEFMGNLFSRGVCPSVIEKMPYHKMKYWNEWHKAIVKAENQPPKKGR
jgi:hypothetical protein